MAIKQTINHIIKNLLPFNPLSKNPKGKHNMPINKGNTDSQDNINDMVEDSNGSLIIILTPFVVI